MEKHSLNYPSTRFMGSKSKLIDSIWDVVKDLEFDTVLDLFSGSGIVSYLFKHHGKQVYSNDHMAMSYNFTLSMVENSKIQLVDSEVSELMREHGPIDTFIQDNFQGLYFNDEDNFFLDMVRSNIKLLEDPYKRAIATSALIRSCMKKRPRGIFTYTGDRYDDGRKDLQLSFQSQFRDAVTLINDATFDNNRQNKSFNLDAFSDFPKSHLIYLDPPYYSKHSDNHYVRRYHFVEGIARNWEGVELQQETKTKKFKNYPSPFSNKKNTYKAFDDLLSKFANSIIVISYSSNSLPTLEEMKALLQKYKKNTKVIEIDHIYSFGTQTKKINNNNNDVKEYLFVGY